MTHVMVLRVVWKSCAIRGSATARIVKVTLTENSPPITVHSTNHRYRGRDWRRSQRAVAVTVGRTYPTFETWPEPATERDRAREGDGTGSGWGTLPRLITL